MPKEAINLDLLLNRLENGEIVADSPLFTYRTLDEKDFYVFQNSGLNILLGKEGNGKTKFLTQVMIELLRKISKNQSSIDKVIYIDTERPESQYAFTIEHLLKNCSMPRSKFLEQFSFFSVSELSPNDIKNVLRAMTDIAPARRSIIILDHILPVANDFNNVSETSSIDHLLKGLIKLGNIIIASIHMPYNGLTKGLGHLGSSIGRQASFILEICNSDDGIGFILTQRKSRISSKNNAKLFLKMDQEGNITNDGLEIINKLDKIGGTEEKEIVVKILKEFIANSMTTKKQLLSCIQKEKKWKPGSSSAHTFYNRHFKDLLLFDKNDYQITEQGQTILNDGT